LCRGYPTQREVSLRESTRTTTSQGAITDRRATDPRKARPWRRASFLSVAGPTNSGQEPKSS
jgi:hypothetical protein